MSSPYPPIYQFKIPNTNTNPPPFLSGTLPPPPSNLQKQIHKTWEPTYIHSALCDGCHTKKHPVLQRCLSCTLQYCKGCMVKAREKGSGHEYIEEDLYWDVRGRPRVFRESGRRRERVGSGVRGFAGGDFKERLMSEEEKYGGQRSENLFGGPGPKSSLEYRRYTAQPDPLDKDENDDDESDDDFHIHLTKRRRMNEITPTRTSTASLRRGEQKVHDGGSDGRPGSSTFNSVRSSTASNSRRRLNDAFSQPRTASLRRDENRLQDRDYDGGRGGFGPNYNSASFASVGHRPMNGEQSITYQNQQHRKQNQTTSTASTASTRYTQTHSNHQHPMPTGSSTASSHHNQAQTQTQTHLPQNAAFSTAVTTALHPQETQQDTNSLPNRREEFEEYCQQAWISDPIIRKLKEEGKAEEARELFDAARDLLAFSRSLGGSG